MSTGDPLCLRCGRFFCNGRCERINMIRKVTPTFDVTDAKYVGPSKDDLTAYLASYLGDVVFAERFADCIDMIKAKNADYSQGEQKGDRVAAFRRISKDVGITMKQAWAVFCQKQWGAVMKFVKQGIVESEPIDGRINDVINYMVLLGAIIKDEKDRELSNEGLLE